MKNGNGIALLFGTLVVLLAAGCGGRMPENLGVQDARLIACPDSPNCVSSFETDEIHSISAIAIVGDAGAAWAALREVVSGTERVNVIREEDGYLYAVYTTKIMRYRDDVEFMLDAAGGEIAVRSASRVGHGDMDANRNRIEAVRAALAAKGVAKAAAK